MRPSIFQFSRLARLVALLMIIGVASAQAASEETSTLYPSTNQEVVSHGHVLLGEILSVEGDHFVVRNLDGDIQSYRLVSRKALHGSRFTVGDHVIGSVTETGELVALTKQVS